MSAVVQLRAGQVVSVMASSGLGFDVDHVGIVSDRRDRFGLPLVISANRRTGKVTEDIWPDFSAGRDVVLLNWAPAPGRSPAEVIRRARARLGQPWDLVNHNCEHFVKDVLGHGASSPQLQAGVAGLLTVGALAGLFYLIFRGLDEERVA